MIKTTIDDREAQRYIRELARVTGAPIEEVVRAEAKSILSTAMKRTPIATAKGVRESARRRYNTFGQDGKYGSKSRNNPKISNGRNVWYLRRSEKDGQLKKFKINGEYHFNKKIFKEYKALDAIRRKRMSAEVKERAARRGLPKQTFLHLAELIGKPFKVPSYVSGARVNGKILRHLSSVSITDKGSIFSMEFTSRSKAAQVFGGEKALISALKGRVKFFQQNMERGVFKTAKATAAKYRGIKVTKS